MNKVLNQINNTIMRKYSIIIFLLFTTLQTFGQEYSLNDYPKSLASYNDFNELVKEVESYREQRLIKLDDFIK